MLDAHILDKLHRKHKALDTELQSANIRLAKKNAQMMESNSSSKSKIKSLQKDLQRTNIRLAKKNANMMDLNKIKNMHLQETKDLSSKIKDLEFLLKERELDISKLDSVKSELKVLESHITQLSKKISEKEIDNTNLSSKNKDLEMLLSERDQEVSRLNESLKEKEELQSHLVSINSQIREREKEIYDVSLDSDKQKLELQKTLEEKSKIQKELDELKKDLVKKDTIIDLLQKTEYDYKNIVSLHIERINAKWIGWPEGANLEEIDYVIVNNSDQTLSDLTMDIYIEDASNYHCKFENIKVKASLNPKERISRKLHLFKQLKKRGNYKVELKVYVDNHSKDIAKDVKILVI